MATKTKRKPRKREPKPRQGYLEEMEPPRIKVLDDAAELYYDEKKDRVTVQAREKAAKVNLIEKMKEAGLTTYQTPDGIVVNVIDKANVTCKRKEDGDDESNGELD